MTVQIFVVMLHPMWVFNVSISIVVFCEKEHIKLNTHWSGKVVICGGRSASWGGCVCHSWQSQTMFSDMVSVCAVSPLYLLSWSLIRVHISFSSSQHQVGLQFLSLPCMLFRFGWPPCQRSDMTLVEAPQRVYNYWCVRDACLFVYLWKLM